MLSLVSCTGDDGDGTAEGSGQTSMETSTTGGSAEGTTPASAGSTDEGEASSAETSSDGGTTATTADETAGTDDGNEDQIVPDFALVDVNPTSATFEQAVSPRDYLEKVSGWYFTHAT